MMISKFTFHTIHPRLLQLMLQPQRICVLKYSTFSCLRVSEHGRKPFPSLHPSGSYSYFQTQLKTYYIKFFLTSLCHSGTISFGHYNRLVLSDMCLWPTRLAMFQPFVIGKETSVIGLTHRFRLVFQLYQKWF